MTGDVGRALQSGHYDQARDRLARWRSLFPDRYYLEVTRLGRHGEEAWLQATLKLAAAELRALYDAAQAT